MISFPGGSGNAAQIAEAQETLTGLFPPAINITLQGGGVVSLPTAFIVNDCNGAQAKSVAVCSFISPSNSFWLASPWFNNHYTYFDMQAPNPSFPGSTGTMYWSRAINDCTF
jgi:hypothetical protein